MNGYNDGVRDGRWYARRAAKNAVQLLRADIKKLNRRITGLENVIEDLKQEIADPGCHGCTHTLCESECDRCAE